MRLAEQLSVISHAPPVTMTIARAQRPNPALGAFSAFAEPDRTVPTRREVRQAAEDNTLLIRAPCSQACPICLGHNKIGHVCRTLPCTHTLHKHCLDNLIHSAGNAQPPKWVQCPECRLHLHPGNNFEAIASRTIEYTSQAAAAADQIDTTRGLPMGASAAVSLMRAATVTLQQQATAAADAAAFSFARALNAMERLRRLIRTHRHELQHFYFVPADEF